MGDAGLVVSEGREDFLQQWEGERRTRPAQTVGEMSTGEQLSHVGGGKDLSLSSEPEVAVALA